MRNQQPLLFTSQSNKFVMGVKFKATGGSKLSGCTYADVRTKISWISLKYEMD